jgi:hypothetical protein
MSKPTTDHAPDPEFRSASEDYRFLLDRGYPPEASLTLVGNRYDLPFGQREMLRRSVVSRNIAEDRGKKLLSIEELEGRTLAVDGFNVLITLEGVLEGRPLVLADDGVVRDIARLSSAYRPLRATRKVSPAGRST